MPFISAIVLAAGYSSRMGPTNKLLLPLGDKRLIERTVDNLLVGIVSEVVVVTGHEDRAIREALAEYPVRVAYNPEYAGGIATSIRRGVLACRSECDAGLLCLGDMPFIRSETIQKVCQVHIEQTKPHIVVAASGGQRGHPVLFARFFRDDLLQLTGDAGARTILAKYPDQVIECEVDDEGIFLDVDTYETYEQLNNRK